MHSEPFPLQLVHGIVSSHFVFRARQLSHACEALVFLFLNARNGLLMGSGRGSLEGGAPPYGA
jgi:maltodextrin utilization protein YvdJ